MMLQNFLLICITSSFSAFLPSFFSCAAKNHYVDNTAMAYIFRHTLHIDIFIWAYTNMGMKHVGMKSTLTKQAEYC